MQVKASQMCLRHLLTADTLCQQPPDDTSTCTKHKYRGQKKWTASVKKIHCPQHEEHSYFYFPLKKFDNEQYFLVHHTTYSKPTAFCAATQPEAESHGYCVYNNNISLQKGPDAILAHSMVFVCILFCCAPSVSKPNRNELSKKQGYFMLWGQLFYWKSPDTGSHCCCNDISAISAVAQNRIDIIQLSLRSQEVLGACVVNGVYH